MTGITGHGFYRFLLPSVLERDVVLSCQGPVHSGVPHRSALFWAVVSGRAHLRVSHVLVCFSRVMILCFLPPRLGACLGL